MIEIWLFGIVFFVGVFIGMALTAVDYPEDWFSWAMKIALIVFTWPISIPLLIILIWSEINGNRKPKD